MDLYLMQHGQALSEAEDPGRPLNREGVAQIQASAAAMKKMGIVLDAIFHSPKKRSKQTAALVAEAVNFPYSDLVETEAVAPAAPARETLAFLHRFRDHRAVLIAGHLPSLGEIASALLTDGSKVHLHFENGGLCRLDLPSLPTTAADLRYFLTPAQLRLLGERP
jgi:phosphohistidine phosphatase